MSSRTTTTRTVEPVGGPCRVLIAAATRAGLTMPAWRVVLLLAEQDRRTVLFGPSTAALTLRMDRRDVEALVAGLEDAGFVAVRRGAVWGVDCTPTTEPVEGPRLTVLADGVAWTGAPTMGSETTSGRLGRRRC